MVTFTCHVSVGVVMVTRPGSEVIIFHVALATWHVQFVLVETLDKNDPLGGKGERITPLGGKSGVRYIWTAVPQLDRSQHFQLFEPLRSFWLATQSM